jgi:uncharacterized protein (DUF433 family)
MPAWKLRIFVRVVKARMEAEQITAEVTLEDYPALTTEEKQSILNAIATN